LSVERSSFWLALQLVTAAEQRCAVQVRAVGRRRLWLLPGGSHRAEGRMNSHCLCRSGLVGMSHHTDLGVSTVATGCTAALVSTFLCYCSAHTETWYAVFGAYAPCRWYTGRTCSKWESCSAQTERADSLNPKRGLFVGGKGGHWN
jgi:hypothetical protein